RPGTGLRDAGRHVDSRRGLAHPALLVGDRVDRAHAPGKLATGGVSRYAAERALASDARTPGVTRRRLTHLLVHVQVMVAGARVWLHVADLGQAKAHLVAPHCRLGPL